METSLRWVNEDEWDRVAETRLRCYAPAAQDLERYRERLINDPRNRGGDILLAEQDGLCVGTAAALPMTMWVRGGAITCQGIAYVGTIKTHRRLGSAALPGIATQLMRKMIERGRERGQIVSALMPFRASYYERFGYGLTEQRSDWTLPMAVLPRGDFSGMRFYEASDLDELTACALRVAQRGQCDIARSAPTWQMQLKRAQDGFAVIDRPSRDGPVRGWALFNQFHEAGKDVLRLHESGYEDIAGLTRLLHFLGSLRDQYAAAVITLPSDVPLNRLLREIQLPHRDVNHATAQVHPYTRMQSRILDHSAFLQSLHLRPDTRGKVTVAIHESEGHEMRLAIEIEAGHAHATPTAQAAQFECKDTIWASIACGDLSATTALSLELAQSAHPDAANVLDVLGRGPAPYCHEYF